jgi:hypothetical protein
MIKDPAVQESGILSALLMIHKFNISNLKSLLTIFSCLYLAIKTLWPYKKNNIFPE